MNRLPSIEINTDEDLIIDQTPDEKDECLIFFDSVNTKKKLQKFVDLYQEHSCIWVTSGHEMSMYFVVHLNTGTRGASIADATSASVKRWKEEGWNVMPFHIDTIEALDKRMGIKRKAGEYKEIKHYLERGINGWE